jgi:hypothetical protein
MEEYGQLLDVHSRPSIIDRRKPDHAMTVTPEKKTGINFSVTMLIWKDDLLY